MNELLGSHEAQLQRVSSRLDEMDTRLAAIAKSVEENTASSEPAAPLLGEFATRGVLSTLKGIEKKVDKLVAQAKAEEKLQEKNLAHKCQAPSSVLEALLQDVASKVDVIFDRLPEEGEAEIRGGDLRVWRRMASPLRRTWRALESVERAVRSAEDTNVQLKKGHDHLLRVANHTLRYAAQGSECCRKLREETHNASVRSTNSCIAAVSAGTETSLRNMRDLFANASQEIEHLEDLILDNIAYNASCPNESPSLVVDAEEQDFSDSSNLLDYEDVSTQSSVPLTSQSSTGRGKRFQWLCSDVNGPSGVTSLLGDLEEEEAAAPVVSEWDGGGQRERLFCDQQTAGGGWTVVQRRGNFDGRLENFTRRWTDYKRGFGDLNAEFWAGNDFLHLVTSGDRPVKLRIELKDFEGNKTFAEYSLFRVGSEKTNYRLTLAGYSGNASDSFSSHNGTPFSTIDRTNDKAPDCCPCAKTYSSGWWFHSCFEANLNGEYFLDPEGATDFQGIIWEKWRDDYSLAGTEMKIPIVCTVKLFQQFKVFERVQDKMRWLLVVGLVSIACCGSNAQDIKEPCDSMDGLKAWRLAVPFNQSLVCESDVMGKFTEQICAAMNGDGGSITLDKFLAEWLNKKYATTKLVASAVDYEKPENRINGFLVANPKEDNSHFLILLGDDLDEAKVFSFDSAFIPVCKTLEHVAVLSTGQLREGIMHSLMRDDAEVMQLLMVSTAYVYTIKLYWIIENKYILATFACGSVVISMIAIAILMFCCILLCLKSKKANPKVFVKGVLSSTFGKKVSVWLFEAVGDTLYCDKKKMRLLLLILSLAWISYGAETRLFQFKEKCRSIAQAKAWRFRVPKTLFDSSLLDTALPDLNTDIFPKLLNLQDWTPVDRPPLVKWFVYQFEALKKKAKLDTTENESLELVPMINGFMIDSPEVLSTSVVLWEESEVKAALLKDIKFASLCEIILLLSGGQDAMIEPLEDAIAEQIVLRVQLLPSYKISLPEIRLNENSHGFGTNKGNNWTFSR
ncbi:Hypothetical predicted protein [Cloeon dipterum]|uniref:Fibrinogen C-terminal domain-containing protein n=1 Tax=Cloeon dipterum TaxID=197152 RepID=A0A8S1BJU0_9INSE|nr:Hypothetical predicted protein [Cloeon dipterum]